MGQTPAAVAQQLAERVGGHAARRDAARVARRRDKPPGVDGVDPRDDGARLDACGAVLQALAGGDGLGEGQGPAVQRARGPFGQAVGLDRLKTLGGLERLPARPALRGSDEALMRLGGFQADPVRHGVCQRGAAQRQGPRTRGPSGAEAWAETIVPLHRRDLAALCHEVIRALAQAGGLAAQVTGSVEAPALEPTAHEEGWGQVTRPRQITDTRGHVHAIEGTGDGWQRIVWSEARTTIPLAATVVPIQAHATRCRRAVVPPARTNLAGQARRQKVGFDQGVWDGVERWWRQPPGSMGVVPAQEKLAVAVDAQAQAAAGAGSTGGRRAHPVRQGQGHTAWRARRETDVGGIAGLTPDAPYGTPAPGRHPHRRDVPPHAINAVVVRQWPGRDAGPGGNTVFVPNAPVDTPVQPFDDDDARRLIAHGWSTERQPPWSLPQPPQKPARAMRVHGRFPLRRLALAPADRLPCARADTRGEPVGWQRWRRQLRQQPRAHVMVVAEDASGLLPRAEDARRLGVTPKEVPPSLGTRRDMLAT